MTKHSTAFKHSVVAFYLSDERSYREVGVRFGIDHSTVRKWVSLHGEHGSAGLSKKVSAYEAAFKLSVLQRMWDDGLSYRQAAAVFNIRNASCLSDWERRYDRGGVEALAPRRRGRPRSMPEPPAISGKTNAPQNDDARSREELLAELNYLRMENAYLKKLEALTREHQAPTRRKPSRR